MRTAVLNGIQELSLVERERPTPDVGEVLVKIEYVGICGSDVHYYESGRNGGNEVSFPHVLGHEPSGTVIEAGEEVDPTIVGKRVSIEPGIPCGNCVYCVTEGAYHLCEEMRYLSSPPVDGAFVEYLAWPEDAVYELPDEISLLEGALVEPLSVAVHACDRSDVGEGDTILVTGGGPIGLLVAEVALARGANPVLLSDVIPGKLALARERGVDHTIDVSKEDLIDGIQRHVGDFGVDVLLECSGVPDVAENAADAVKRGGTVVFVGIPPTSTSPSSVVDAINNELDLRGSFRFSNTYPEAIDGIARGTYDVDGIVDFETDLTGIERAFERATDPEVVKGVVRVGDER